MKLLTVRTATGPVAHVDTDAGLSPIHHADGGTYRDVAALLAAGDDGLGDARRAAAGSDSSAVAPGDADVLRPVLEPGAVICVGLNYRSHILEMGRDLPAVPTLFSKLARALTDPNTSIPLPFYSEQLDYEGELGVVIGRGGRDLAPDDAWQAVGGLTIVNDVTVRDVQWRTPQWFAGKTGEALTPVGPAVVTADEFADGIDDLCLRLTVNGEPRQEALLGDLVFDVAQLVADVSRFVTLRPGDIIATGTPGGVAAAMEPPRWLGDGDVVEVSIDRIGTLRNTFHTPAPEARPAAAVGAGEG